MKRTLSYAILGIALLAAPAATATESAPVPQPGASSPVLNLQGWLQLKWQQLKNPFRPDERDREPRAPRSGTPTEPTCDPARTKCPVG